MFIQQFVFLIRNIFCETVDYDKICIQTSILQNVVKYITKQITARHKLTFSGQESRNLKALWNLWP